MGDRIRGSYGEEGGIGHTIEPYSLRFEGGPRDGQRSAPTSFPPHRLKVDDSEGEYVYRDGAYRWNASP